MLTASVKAHTAMQNHRLNMKLKVKLVEHWQKEKKTKHIHRHHMAFEGLWQHGKAWYLLLPLNNKYHVRRVTVLERGKWTSDLVEHDDWWAGISRNTFGKRWFYSMLDVCDKSIQIGCHRTSTLTNAPPSKLQKAAPLQPYCKGAELRFQADWLTRSTPSGNGLLSCLLPITTWAEMACSVAYSQLLPWVEMAHSVVYSRLLPFEILTQSSPIRNVAHFCPERGNITVEIWKLPYTFCRLSIFYNAVSQTFICFAILVLCDDWLYVHRRERKKQDKMINAKHMRSQWPTWTKRTVRMAHVRMFA